MVIEFQGKKIYFNGEVLDTFDIHGPYCHEVEFVGEDDDGVQYSAIGISNGIHGEIIEIEEDTVEVIE